jgi:hypothetical protein
MLHLIPPSSYGDLCVKALDSILTAYGHEVLVEDFAKCEAWHLDEICDRTIPVILQNFNAIVFNDYLDSSGVRRIQDTQCWQMLPNSYQECDRIIQELGCLIEKKVTLHLLLLSEHRNWEDIFTRISSASKEIIRKGGGNIHLIPILDLSAVSYTMVNNKVNQSLFVGVSRLSPEIRASIKKIIETFLKSLKTQDLLNFS